MKAGGWLLLLAIGYLVLLFTHVTPNG